MPLLEAITTTARARRVRMSSWRSQLLEQHKEQWEQVREHGDQRREHCQFRRQLPARAFALDAAA